MKILVTGANGLLGQHLIKLLLEKGHYVIATGKDHPGYLTRRDLFSRMCPPILLKDSRFTTPSLPKTPKW